MVFGKLEKYQGKEASASRELELEDSSVFGK